MVDHPLADILRRAGQDEFPDWGPITVLPAPPHLNGAVVAFSGHTFIAADVEPGEVRAHIGENPLTGPVLPSFLEWLSSEIGARAGMIDVVLAARGTGAPDPVLKEEPGWREYERAQHGARLRRELSGWTAEGLGLILIGRGLVDRWELAYEVAPDAPAGSGRMLASLALGLVPQGEPLFAQVAPGHARSLRACVAAGYRPIGSEILFSDISTG
jgi:hypothetical protein